MDTARFAALARAVTAMVSRRAFAAALALSGVAIPDLVDARKRKRRRKKKKKVKFNDFGCVNVGKFCQNNGQCCSGICQGKKDKRKCKAHDTGGCQPGSAAPACGGTEVICTTSPGGEGRCGTTTGNAGYCFNAVALGPTCTKDAECQAVLSSETAACVQCPPGEPFCASGILF